MGKLIFLVLTILMFALAIYFGIKKYKLVEQRKKEKAVIFQDKWQLALDHYQNGKFNESLTLTEEVLLEFPDFREAEDMREVLSEVIKKKRVDDAISHSKSIEDDAINNSEEVKELKEGE